MKFIKKLFEQKYSSKTLNDVISPEIKDDPFYDELKKYAANPNLNIFLEIGSSSGQGSTEAFVSAIRARPDEDLCSLFCMEISKPRFEQLQLTYSNDHFVKPFNLSSISPEEFPTESEIIDFYKTHKTNLNHYPMDTILGWYRQDLHYLQSNFACLNGIQ